MIQRRLTADKRLQCFAHPPNSPIGGTSFIREMLGAIKIWRIKK